MSKTPIRVRHGAGSTRAYVAALAAALGTPVKPRVTNQPAPDQKSQVIPARIIRRMKMMKEDDLRGMSMAQQKREKRLARNRRIAGHPEPIQEDAAQIREQKDLFN
jgi:hypothetical protein